MFNYKNVVLTLLSISLVFSDQFENYFNGAIPSYTKTPKKGKMNIGLSFGSGVFSQNFNQDGELSDLASSTSFSSLGLGFRYHGFNGAGVELVVMDNSEAGGSNMLSVYFVWNEMYTDKNPAILPFQHSYTFPLSRNISKISVFNFEEESYYYLNHSIDLIVSSKFILSTAINITSDTEVASNLLSSHFIYDIDDYFSISCGINHYTNDTSNKTELQFDAGYQFKNILAGNLNMNFKLIPELVYVFSGENTNADHRFNLKLQTYFN